MAIIGVDSEVAWHEWDPVYYHFQCKLGMLLMFPIRMHKWADNMHEAGYQPSELQRVTYVCTRSVYRIII